MCNILEYWKIITYYLVYMSWYLKPISQEWCHFPACLKRPKRFIAPRFPKVAVGVGLSYAPAMLVQKIRSAPAVSLDDIDGWTTIWHMAGSFFPLHGLGFYITSRWFRIWAMGFYEWRYEDDVLCFQKLVHVGAESVSQWLPCCFCKKSWARSHGQGQEEGWRGGMHIVWTCLN